MWLHHGEHLYEMRLILTVLLSSNNSVTNFIQPYLHQFFNNSHSLNGYEKPLKRPFN